MRLARRLPPLLPAAILVAGAAFLFTGGEHAAGGFPLDDAWIHRVYARALAGFQGFAYNPGQQETGATSPLWALVSAPAHWLQPAGDHAVVLAVKWLGVALAAVALTGLTRLGRRLTGSAAVGLIAACVLAAEPRLAFAALSGMETPLALALWFWGTALLLEGRTRLGPLLLGLAVTARPELVVVVGLTLLLGLIARGGRLAAWTGAALAATPSLLWAAFCLIATGRPLPATWYVKQEPFHLDAHKWHQFFDLLTQPGWLTTPLLVLGLAATLVLLWRRRDRAALTVALGLSCGPLLIHLLVVGGRSFRLDGYYWTRWSDLQVLGLLAFCLLGIGAVLVGTGGVVPTRSRLSGRIVAGVLLFSVFAGVPSAWSERRARLESDGAAIERMNIHPARWVAEFTPPDAVIGVNDAGALRYFGERETVDLIGLNFHERAFGAANLDAMYRRVDWICVFPGWWSGTNLLDGFVERKRFSMPPAEYTICDCPAQTLVVVAEKRR